MVEFGGGGTVWDSMAYDPELDLLFIGVGNGFPWNHDAQPGQGRQSVPGVDRGGRSRRGAYAWHYRVARRDLGLYRDPADRVADSTIAGRNRKVVMQAPKNGFFYVLDGNRRIHLGEELHRR